MDLDQVQHTVEVSASSLYEAIALGIAIIRRSDWAGQLPTGLTEIKVRVMDISAEHVVRYIDFEKWLERGGNTPIGMTQRDRVREILAIKETTGN